MLLKTLLVAPLLCQSLALAQPQKTPPRIHIAFQWHMHQPIYWPYESVKQTQMQNRYSYNLFDVFNQRAGPYTTWPRNAIASTIRAQLPHAGAQVSFSGSLIENLNELFGSQWSHAYAEASGWRTSQGNPRLDLVAFGYHHPMMPLISYREIRDQIASHRKIISQTFGSETISSRGIFPPENAFANRMIPALVDEDIEWVMVDNIHFNRARQDYPWTRAENLFPPNPAEQRNPVPKRGKDWIQLNGVWAPSKVSSWADRPHWVVQRDPDTGEIAITPEGKVAKIIAVPTERYLGNEDGRGGFGALNYEGVLSQLEAYNDDPEHPILIVLHHDGDNYGGGTESYYHSNFDRMVEWLKANQHRFELTTIQDYLDRFPPKDDDIIHVEPGSWSGADNGDPEFKKWFSDPVDGYSPDRNSWSVLTMAQNVIDQAITGNIPADILQGAKRLVQVAQTSCYEYWDGTEEWDSHPTRATNQMLDLLLKQYNLPTDNTPPSILVPQREPYNPGGMEWGKEAESTDFTVWTYVYDVSGVQKTTLHYRPNRDTQFPQTSADYSWNMGEWNELEMESRTPISRTNPQPLAKADEYSAKIIGIKDSLVSYFVEAMDTHGNRRRSELLHVYVGAGGSEPANTGFTPSEPTHDDVITVYSDRPATLHWGVNGWIAANKVYHPAGSVVWSDGKAVRTHMQKSEGKDLYQTQIGPFNRPEQEINTIEFTLQYSDGSWRGQDTHITLATTPKLETP